MGNLLFSRLVLGLLCVAVSALAAGEPHLEMGYDAPSGRTTLHSTGGAGTSHRIEAASAGLSSLDWVPMAAAPGGDWSVADVDSMLRPQRFYRLVEVVPPVITPHASWKKSIVLPDDAFFSDPLNQPGLFEGYPVRWVKFSIVLDALPDVIFQNSRTYRLHYPFATERLGPFAGMGVEAFDAVSLRRQGQRVVLGAVLVADGANEYGIQFVGEDAYPREMVRFLYGLVDAALAKPPGVRGYYIPAPGQDQMAEAERDYFTGQGIAVSSMSRWVTGNTCYTFGWALGRLKFIPGAGIAAAYIAGDLRPGDILLTEAVPAEVPYVAGIVSLSPSTPNSHVAILARAYGIPFAYVADQPLAERLLALDGREVAFKTAGPYDCAIAAVETEAIDPVYRASILALKTPPPLEYEAIAPFGVDHFTKAQIAAAVPADIRFVGGKASNYGFLRRVVPDRSPEAVAFTFDLWSAYLDQPVSGGQTLRAWVNARLGTHAWPPNIGRLEADLSAIRATITDGADFTAAQKASILGVLAAAGFPDDRNIRFRSSTNVEDSAHFVGAGLYDSYSGCLRDDTDGDAAGPSHCDPTESKERGVFRALRKVYASFYNLNATVERLRRGVDESKVGMAVLAHGSFPDETEAANGVATSDLNFYGSFREIVTTMVSQVGAESITNPTGGHLPEIVALSSLRGNFGESHTASILQRSSLVRLGEPAVMNYEADYRAFADEFFDLVDAYRAHYGPAKTDLTLEFEYKKLTNGSRIIKQVREVPAANSESFETIALVDQTSHFMVFQGERGDVFGNHRLKLRWQAQTASRWLDAAGLANSFLTGGQLTQAPDGAVVDLPGAPATWPGYQFRSQPGPGNERSIAVESWAGVSAGGATRYTLSIGVPAAVQGGPVATLADFDATMAAVYAAPQMWIDWDGAIKFRTDDFAQLVAGSPDDPLPQGSIRVARDHASKGGARVTTAFHWPPDPGLAAGYTAPLIKWEKTMIAGLTAQPIELTGYFSQTYRPGHHNFTEEFLFEPRLDPGVSAAQRAELEGRNIRLIYLQVGLAEPHFKTISAAGVVTDVL